MSRFDSDSEFNIMMSSDSEYERLVAEIYFDNKYVALVKQEKGLGQFEIEFPDHRMVNESVIARTVDLNGFIDAVKNAKNELLN